MSLRTEFEFLFVGRDENSFLENYSCDFHRDNNKESGQIFANIEIKNEPVIAEDIAISIYDTMQEFFFQDLSLSPYQRFENTLKEINKKLKEFSSSKKDGFIGDLNVLIGGVVGNELFLSQTGDAEAYLIRKRYVSVISEGLSDSQTEGEIFSNIASGYVEAGDFVLFSNTRILRYISKNDLAYSVSRGVVMDILMDIRDVLSTEMLGRLSMTGILFSPIFTENVEKAVLSSPISKEVEDLIVRDDLDDLDKTEIIENLMKSDDDSVSYLHQEKTFFDKKESRMGAGLSGRVKKYFFDFISNFSSFFSSRNSKNKILFLLLGIIVVLVISIIVANSMSDKRKKMEGYEKILEAVQIKITEAETRGTFDKDGAVSILDRAYEEALSVLNSGYYRDKANLYLVKINETRDRLDQVVRVSSDDVFMDLTKTDPLINALGSVVLSDRVFVYSEDKLYEVTLDALQEGIVMDLSEVIIDATGYEDRNSVLFLTKSGKVMEYREGVVSFMNTDDGNFRKGVSIDDWGHRIYLLDPDEGQIWRYTYQGTREKYGVAEAYFSVEYEEVKGAKDFVIDSYIYVLDGSSNILRFYAGTKSDVMIVNAPYNGFENANIIYTNERMNKLFVADDKAKRVFVFDKDNANNRLTYQTQYLFDKDVSIRGLWSDLTSGKLYILTESKVYEL